MDRTVIVSFPRKLSASLALALLLGPPGEARAQCTGNSLYSVSTSGAVASAPANDTNFNTFAKSMSYLAQGSYVYGFDNSRSGTTTAYWTSTAFASTVQNFPAPVPLSNSAGEFIFVAAGDGKLYKVNAQTGATVQSVDTRRTSSPSCTADTLTATPTVQLYDFSNLTFKNAMKNAGHDKEDLVMVITRRVSSGSTASCNTSTKNQVIAYYAKDLTLSPKWRFNNTLGNEMDFGSEGCAIDYDNNRIYCGTNKPSSATYQPTVWAISTIDGADGTSDGTDLPVWSVDAGSVRARPQLANGRLYVGSYDGTLRAGNPETGSQYWSLSVTTSTITTNVWPEFRQGGWANMVLVRSDAGILYAVNDQSSSGTTAWSTSGKFGGVLVTTMPAISNLLGKVYVGVADGKVHQLNMNDGTDEAYVTAGTGTVYDPSLDLSSTSATAIDRMVVVSTSGGTGQARRYCVPLTTNTMGTTNHRASTGQGCNADTECPTSTDPCWASKCDLPSKVCYRVPLDHKPCDDRIPCSCDATHKVKDMRTGLWVCDGAQNSDLCLQGVCTADFYEATCGNSYCNSVGDRACAFGTACCGQKDGCVDLTQNSQHCGECFRNCPTGTTCLNGNCRRLTLPCNAPSALDLNTIAGQLEASSAVAFEMTTEAQCSAYLSTFYSSPVGIKNRIRKVSMVNGTPQLGTPFIFVANLAPLNGVAVSFDGVARFGGVVNQAGAPFIPGLAVPDPFKIGDLLLATVLNTPKATAGGADHPFSDPRFNMGPVGPAFDRGAYNTSGQVHNYFGNWTGDGDVVKVSCTQAPCELFTVTALGGFNNPSGERITAIAKAGNFLYVGHGTTASRVDLDGRLQQVDLDFSRPDTFYPVDGEGVTTRIYSLTADPLYDDVYAELGNANGDSFLVHIRADDASIRNLHRVGEAQYGKGHGIPALFKAGQGLNEGRLTLDGQKDLFRIVPKIDKNPVFQEWDVHP